MKSGRFLVLVAAAWLFPGSAFAQGKYPWEEYGKLASSRQAVVALESASLFGEQVDLYSGMLSFTATDLDLPGNSALPVAVRRKFVVTENDDRASNDFPFAEWEIDVPNVRGTFAITWHDERCTKPVPYPSYVNSNFTWALLDPYGPWHGNSAEMPSGGPMLVSDVVR